MWNKNWFLLDLFFRRGKGRTQLSLLPRSLHRQTGSESKAENGTAPKPTGGESGDAGNEAQAKPLSNSDFAKMLFKKWKPWAENNKLPLYGKPSCVLEKRWQILCCTFLTPLYSTPMAPMFLVTFCKKALISLAQLAPDPILPHPFEQVWMSILIGKGVL